MKITDIKALAIPDIKVIRFALFCDARSYFTEHFRVIEQNKILFTGGK